MAILKIHTDGGARGNPGPAAVGVTFELGDWRTTHQRCIGNTTNNVAEYTAVLDAVQEIEKVKKEHAISSLAFYLDSELVVKQLQGKYRVKEPTLQQLHAQVQLRLHALGFPFQFTHVPRAQNAQADALVNQALDGQHE